MAALPIIHDCDPGQDDAIALLLALASPELELLGVTPVAGNVPLSLTTGNACKILELAGRTGVGVYPGCPRPLLKPAVTAEHIHGQSGMAGTRLPAPSLRPRDRHGVDFIIDTLLSREGVVLCPTGPLTNLAVAMIKVPAIIPRIQRIVLMGGAIHGGNIRPAAEYNIYADPHAARVVFDSGAPLVMLGLDVTHQALATAARRERIRALGNPVASVVADIMAAYPYADKAQFPEPGMPLHDPTVMLYLIRPELFQGRDCHVEIVTDGPAEGMTVVDWWGTTGRAPNARVIHRVAVDALFALVEERLGRYPL